ncbi:MAG: response regulator transcription factor [Xanthobacteraceae bacterium]
MAVDAPAGRDEIFVVDDDPSIRQTLRIVFSKAGHDVICFADGDALLAAARAKCPYCIVLDVNIPGRSGLEILRELREEDYPAPAIMISGSGDVSIAVEAMRSGALDFIEKPFRGNELLLRVQTAMTAFIARRSGRPEEKLSAPYIPGRQPLTRREREVLELIGRGISNKEASRKLGISPRTVEDHRLNIMKKLGAKNAVDMMRIVLGSTADASGHGTARLPGSPDQSVDRDASTASFGAERK